MRVDVVRYIPNRDNNVVSADSSMILLFHIDGDEIRSWLSGMGGAVLRNRDVARIFF